MNASTALPNELWSQTLSYLSKKELKAVRLVGDKHLETLASSLLFRTAYIAARQRIFDIFMKITTHPTIRHFIKEVVYDSSWFDPPDGASHMRSGIWRITGQCPDPPSSKLFQEQERLQTRELYQGLKTAFAALTSVRRVVFVDLSRTAGLPGDITDSDARPLVSRISSGSRTIEIGKCCLLRPNKGECGSHRGVFRRQYDGIFMLMKILSEYAPTTFDELSIGDGRHSSDSINYTASPRCVGSSYGGIANWLFSPSPGCSLHENHHLVFRRLRKLDLTLCFPDKAKSEHSWTSPARGCPSLSTLRGLLREADGLEEVKLCGHIDTGMLDFNEILTGKTWSRLRILELKYFDASHSNLKDFLVVHKDSLQHLKLDFLSLIGGSWQGVADVVLCEIPNLDIVVGWVWHNGTSFEPNFEEDDPAWVPRERKDRLECDEDELDPEDDDRESSSDDELDYSSGSDGWDDEDLNAEMLRHWAAPMMARF